MQNSSIVERVKQGELDYKPSMPVQKGDSIIIVVNYWIPYGGTGSRNYVKCSVKEYLEGIHEC